MVTDDFPHCGELKPPCIGGPASYDCTHCTLNPPRWRPAYWKDGMLIQNKQSGEHVRYLKGDILKPNQWMPVLTDEKTRELLLQAVRDAWKDQTIRVEQNGQEFDAFAFSVHYDKAERALMQGPTAVKALLRLLQDKDLW